MIEKKKKFLLGVCDMKMTRFNRFVEQVCLTLAKSVVALAAVEVLEGSTARMDLGAFPLA